MSSFIFTAETKDVVLARLVRFIHSLPLDKSAFEFKCQKFVKERTDQQNKALFGHAYKILRDETGHSLDDLHEHFCRTHFGEIEIEVNGKVHSKPRRSTTRDERGKRDVIAWDEFSEFYALVENTATEMGIYIPPPNKDWWKEKAA